MIFNPGGGPALFFPPVSFPAPMDATTTGSVPSSVLFFVLSPTGGRQVDSVSFRTTIASVPCVVSFIAPVVELSNIVSVVTFSLDGHLVKIVSFEPPLLPTSTSVPFVVSSAVVFTAGGA